MKTKYSKYVMKMAITRKILNEENEFISQSIDKYFAGNKVPVQLSVVSFHLLRFVCELREKSVGRK